MPSLVVAKDINVSLLTTMLNKVDRSVLKRLYMPLEYPSLAARFSSIGTPI